jgi:hypothetical protein
MPTQRIRRAADLARDPAGDGDEQEGEEQRDHSADDVDADLRQHDHRDEAEQGTDEDDAHGKVPLRARHVVASLHAAEVTESGYEGRPDGRKRTRKADQSRRGHRASADVVDVLAAHVHRVHVLDELRRRKDGRREPRAEEFDRRNEAEERQQAPSEQIARDARPDDVADTRELGTDLCLDLAEELHLTVRHHLGEGVLGSFEERMQASVEELVAGAEPEAHEDRLGLFSATLPDDQHLRARGALGILEVGVLLHDEASSYWHEEEHAEHAADDADGNDLDPRELVAEEE